MKFFSLSSYFASQRKLCVGSWLLAYAVSFCMTGHINSQVAISDEPLFDPYTGELVPPDDDTLIDPYTGEIIPPDDDSLIDPYTGEIIPPDDDSIIDPYTGELITPSDISEIYYNPLNGEIVTLEEYLEALILYAEYMLSLSGMTNLIQD